MKLTKILFVMALVSLLLLSVATLSVFSEEVVLKIMFPGWWGGWTDKQNNYFIPEFNKMMAEKGIKLEYVEYPAPDATYKEKLVLDLAAGEAPDLLFIDLPWVGELVDAEYLADLTPKMNQWNEWDQWPPATKGAVTFMGKVWALQEDTDTRPILYRKDVFAKAGIPIPWQPKSWDDLLEAARTIKEKVPGVAPFTTHFGTTCVECTTMNGFYPFLIGAGGYLYDRSANKWVSRSQALEDAFRFFKTIYDEDLSLGKKFWLAGAAIDKAQDKFTDESLAMIITWDGVYFDYSPGGTREIPNWKEKIGYAMIPAKSPGAGLDGRSFTTMSGGWGFAISSKCKDIDAAWEFLKLRFGKEGALYMLDETKLPLRKDVTSVLVPKMDDYTKWRAQTVLPITAFRPPLAIYPRVSELIARSTESILLDKTVEEIMAAYEKDLKALVGAANTISK